MCFKMKWNGVNDEINKVKRIGGLLDCLVLRQVYEK